MFVNYVWNIIYVITTTTIINLRGMFGFNGVWTIFKRHCGLKFKLVILMSFGGSAKLKIGSSWIGFFRKLLKISKKLVHLFLWSTLIMPVDLPNCALLICHNQSVHHFHQRLPNQVPITKLGWYSADSRKIQKNRFS